MINGKYYIGKHKTNDLNDDYLGSGTLIRSAIRKYGRRNFKREILYVAIDEEDMDAAESRLVVISDETYNLCPGGRGGWTYINQNGLQKTQRQKDNAFKQQSLATRKSIEKRNDLLFHEEWNTKISRSLRGRQSTFLGKSHREDTKRRIGRANSTHQIGEGNSQYGSFWITDGVNSMKCRGDIPPGWSRGRTMKKVGLV